MKVFKIKVICIFLLLILLFISLYLRENEGFQNYMVVHDNKDFYSRFLDFIHGQNYRIPYNTRKGLIITDLRGDPHFIDYKSKPKIINNRKNIDNHLWMNPPDKKLILLG